VEVSIAKEMGASALILASTGNMAASCACYAAAAKMPCYVLVPEGVSLSKLAQVIAFGGRIVQVKGNYNDAARLAHELAEKKGFYLAGDYAFRVEGQKTAAFEVIDQLFFNVPDAVVLPIGCGTNMAAYAKGFEEYRSLGLISKLPKLIGVQSNLANAVVNSFEKEERTITALSSANTLASAIAVPNPIDGIKALDAIYKSNGSAVSVSDQEILEAQYLLSTEENLFVESASAATLAAVMKMISSDPELYRDQTFVCVLTGDGLKDAHVLLESFTKTQKIYPASLDALLEVCHEFK
jgi:threonine synthase